MGRLWSSAVFQQTPYGHAWDKGVISALYPKDANGQLIFLETNYRF
jgi:hypothetical protein